MLKRLLGALARRRASTFFLVGVLVTSAAGTWYLWHQDTDTRSVYVAKRDLPAYHQIGLADIRRVRVAAGKVPDGATADPARVVGRYTVTAARGGRPLRLTDLGPRLPDRLLEDRSVVGLPASGADVGAGLVARGDHINVLLSSTAVEKGRSGALSGALVLDVKSLDAKAGTFVVVIAFATRDEPVLQAAGGTARFFIVRTPQA